jgi:hypothetical protein
MLRNPYYHYSFNKALLVALILSQINPLFDVIRPPLWSSGQEFLTTDPGVPGSISGHYIKKVVGLERGPLSLVSTTEELFDRKVAAPV